MGIFTTRELRARGLDSRALRGRLDDGSLWRVARGLYADQPLDDLSRHLLLRPTAEVVLGLESAALVHGLSLRSCPERVQLVEPGAGRSRVRAGHVLHSLRLDPDDVVRLGAVQVTTLARTLVDLGRLRSESDALVPWESALWEARLARELDALSAGVASTLGRAAGLKGVERARHLSRWASPWSESPMESLSRLALRGQGFPEPVQQFEVRDDRGQLVGRADFAWPAHGVLGEYDGRDKYESLARAGESPRDVMLREKRRQQAMELQGWVFARWESRHVAEPSLLFAVLHQAFRLAGMRRVA